MSLRNLTLPLFAAFLIIIIAISEVVTHPKPPPGPVRITYWEKWTGFEGDAIRAVVDEFNRSQNKIFVDLLTISSIENKTLLAVAGGNPPDVAGLYGPRVAQYADAKAIMALDAYCQKAGIREEQYIPAYWDMGFYKGHVYAMPTTPASTALHFNREMLESVGRNPDDPPKTIEELNELADKLTTRDKSGKIIRAGFMPNEPDWWRWGWGYVFGGQLWDGKGKITANSPENVRAFEWVQSFFKKYGVSDLQTFRSGFGNFSSPQNAFLSEKVAMQLQGVWMYNFIDKYSPKLRWSAAAFPYPADHPELKDGTFVDEDILVIPRGAEHPDEAFEFIKFVQSQKGMELLCMGQRKHTPLVNVSAEFMKKHPNPYIKLFGDLPRGKATFFPPKIGIWPEYQDELNNAFDQIAQCKEGETPKVILDRVQARMQPKLDAYLERQQLREEQEKREQLVSSPSNRGAAQ